MNENELSPVQNQEVNAPETQNVSVENTNESKTEKTEEVAKEAAVSETPKQEETAKEATIEPNSHPEDSFKLISEEEIKEIEDDEEEQVDYSSLSREQLIEQLSDLLQDSNIEAIRNKVAAIKVAFHEKTREENEKDLETKSTDEKASDGGPQEFVPEDQNADVLEQRFNEVFNVYKEKRTKFLEEVEEQKKNNLVAKQQILEQLKELINSEETLKTTYDKFKELQERWKEIGDVPKADVSNLWQNYHFLVEKFFDKVKINRELRDLDIKKNLEAKIKLCEKAEELFLEKSIMKSFKKLQSYHQEWKEIGPVPADKRDELWDRFKTATDKINARRKEHYFQIKDQQDSNYAAKLAIVEEAEKLTEILPDNLKDWQTVGDKLNELFKAWKTVGPASKAQNDKIWTRFKSILDNFFAAKKEFFLTLKEQQYNNYNLKIDLCTQAEAVKDSTNWNEATQTLIKLQKEWKEIGPTPKKLSDKIWKRFRSACDEFFTRKEAYFSSINQVSEENLTKKLAIIDSINNLQFSDNVQDSLEELKKLQREWMETGHVPRKDKDTIHASYRKAINTKLDELRNIGIEVANINFRNKIDMMKDNPNAGQMMNKERNQIFNRIQSMKEDVSLWENNIGFLSNSANSALLKAEFEKKIQNAKKEITLLEAKLKYLNGQE